MRIDKLSAFRAATTIKDRRDGARRPVSIRATLRASSGIPVSGVIENLSEGGCALSLQGAKGAVPVPTGGAFSIRFGQLEAQSGWCVWGVDYRIGIRFDNPISSYVVDHLAAGSPARKP
ncbi:MAG: PilZ domain-containing protein [Erythrobacter sp.]|jgi:hypothetical protein|nr:PilZ domain-containing protein [Erythrobacter sp.]